jgi:hypothetical protein
MQVRRKNMDSYIVRVYRRGGDAEELAGLVETVGSDQRKVFQTLSGLITSIREVIGRNETALSHIHKTPPVE